jgi:2'-5' RNA ligase
MAGIRSFIAIELTEDMLGALVAVRKALQSEVWIDDVRWVRPAGIHLTLKFLGDVPSQRISAIEHELGEAVRGVAPFAVTAQGLGVFPNWRRPRVIWIGLGGETDMLGRLQLQIEDAMAGLGFEPEQRRFHPHFTLGRVNQHASTSFQRRLGEELESYEVNQIGEMLVDEVSLMRSQLNPKGAIYTQLAAFPLE